MILNSSRPASWVRLSPWLILGLLAILAATLLILAARNINHEKEFVTRTLLSQGNTLIQSIEAGSRTGMMGMGWGRNQHQALLQQMAQQTGVLYIALIASNGRIMAHSDPDRVDTFSHVSLPKPDQAASHFTEGENRAFEVVREFRPWHRGRGRGADKCEMGAGENQFENWFIVVGLDPSPFEEAGRQDMQHTVVLFGLLFLGGAAGLLSLTWAQHYRNARGALKAARVLTSAIINQMPAGLLIADRDGKIRESNEMATKILGMTGGMARKLDDIPCFPEIARQLGNERSAIEQEIQCTRADGAKLSLLVNAAPVEDEQGRGPGFLILFSDLTNVKQLEEKLRRSERLAGLGRLAAGVAHEIRNPLSSIKGFAAILSGKFKDGDQSRIIADSMINETNRLNKVISELLDFAGTTSLRKEIRSCREMLDYSFRLVQSDTKDRGIQLECFLEPDDFEMEADPDRFAQIMLNLYLNAFQAMEGGGILRVDASLREGRVEIRVSDTGTGIPPEHLPHIFDPYFTTKPKGVGLGLANVHKLVEAHGGTIEAQSTIMKGTAITLRFPVNERRPGEDAGAETPSHSHSR
ncbi:MAG: ATP-binding protein [Syntrophobacter sp.]